MPYLDTITEKRRLKSEKIQAEYTAAKLAAVLKEHLKGIEKSDTEKVIKVVSQIKDPASSDVVKLLEEIKTSLKRTERIVVPAPEIRVDKSVIDTSKIEELLNEIMGKLQSAPKSVVEKASEQPEPLIYYTAQDLDNAPDGSQYIGFMSLSGNWYIMNHDTETDRNLYHFSDQTYQDAWDKRYSLEFKPLSEAR